MKVSLTTFLLALSSVTSVGAWSATPKQGPAINGVASRRALLAGGAAAILGGALTPQPAAAKSMNLGDPNSVVGREVRSFQGLVNEFKNTSLDGGLDASKLNEPSISFEEFGKAMVDKKVEFVEFIAPNGDAAYVTLKGDKKPIRIGQGYPTSSKKSWSSPEYVIRSVSNFGVPYAFTVPGLATYKNKV